MKMAINANSIFCQTKPLMISDWKASAMQVNGFAFATCCTQLGNNPIGITDAERNNNGKVVSNPTERVVSAFFVFRATNRDIPDHAIPNKAAKMKITIAPKTPEAMFTPKTRPISNIIATWMTVVRALLNSLPNKMEDLLIGATLILSMNPLSKSLTKPIPVLSAEEAMVCIMTAAEERDVAASACEQLERRDVSYR